MCQTAPRKCCKSLKNNAMVGVKITHYKTLRKVVTVNVMPAGFRIRLCLNRHF